MNSYLWKGMNPSPAGSVIGGGVEWQPPYVPERLRTGYNNKPLREVANKNNMDKSTSYHNLALREITPPHFTFFQRFFFAFSSIFSALSSSSAPAYALLFFMLTSARFHHVIPLNLPLHVGRGGAVQLSSAPHHSAFVLFPSFVPLSTKALTSLHSDII